MKPSLEQLTAQFTRLVGQAPAVPALAPTVGQVSDLTSSPISGSPNRPGQVTDLPHPPAATPAATPKSPIQATDPALKGYHFDATVAPSQVVAAAEILDQCGFALDTITGVDWIAQNEMELVYDFFHPEVNFRAVVRARVPRANPELPTISLVFPGANWHERETHDFFGIRFLGHPNLKPFLLPEDADFHPLRKDYQP